MLEGHFGQLLLIFVLALVFLGPEKLPRVVAEFGRWVGRARAMARQFREQLEEEVRFEEAKKAQAATPPEPAQPPASETPPASPPPPPVDVASALNPHTEPQGPGPIDVSALPPELAQAAQSMAPPAAEESQAGHEPATAPAEHALAAVPPAAPLPAHEAPRPVNEGQPS
jgi:sec-independent protein translocase protein TatB